MLPVPNSGIHINFTHLLISCLLLCSGRVFSTSEADCVFLSDCPSGLNHSTLGRGNEESIKILRDAHCGEGNKNGNKEPKVYCQQIPDFETLESRFGENDCVAFRNCPQVVKLLQTRRDDPEVTELLRSATCGTSRRRDMIWCSRFAEPRVEEPNLLPDKNCGLLNAEPKIFGGYKADLDEFPWTALIKYKNRNGNIKYGCHGSLINDKYVLTAAHCIVLPPDKKESLGELHKVVLGEYDIRKDIDCIELTTGTDCALPLQEISVDTTHPHPDFSFDGYNDIALVRMKSSAKYTDFIKPVCLPSFDLTLRPNEPLWITGWGRTETQRMSDIKLKAQIFYVTKQQCSLYFSGELRNTQMCAGSTNGSDTCRGDSGGPLMRMRILKGNINVIQVGVVSFGLDCGSRVAVYTNVMKYMDWIKRTIKI